MNVTAALRYHSTISMKKSEAALEKCPYTYMYAYLVLSETCAGSSLQHRLLRVNLHRSPMLWVLLMFLSQMLAYMK